MSRNRLALGMGLALMGLIATAPRADAAYSYTAALTITSVSGSGGTIVNTPGVGATFTTSNGTVVTLGNITNPGSFMVGSPLLANFGNVGVTSTSATPESFQVFYTINGTLTDPFPGGPSFTAMTTGVLTFSGIQGVPGTAGTISNQFLGPYSIGPGTFPNGDTFTTSVSPVLNQTFSSPTVNGKIGNVGGLIVSSVGAVVPEPASIAMVGLGLVGLGGFSAYRRRRAA
jgi:hypothetical protein